MDILTQQDSNGRTWQEVRSKLYSLKEISDYLKDCLEKPQNETAVYFTIRDGGELTITTKNESPEWEFEIETRGFTEIVTD